MQSVRETYHVLLVLYHPSALKLSSTCDAGSEADHNDGNGS